MPEDGPRIPDRPTSAHHLPLTRSGRVGTRALETAPPQFVVSRAHLKSEGGHLERTLTYVDPQKLERAFAGSPLYIGPFGANPRGEAALCDSRARVRASLVKPLQTLSACLALCAASLPTALPPPPAQVLAALEFIRTGERLLVSCARLDGFGALNKWRRAQLEAARAEAAAEAEAPPGGAPPPRDAPPPQLSLTFIDGKHRFLAYRDLGMRCIPLLVPCEQRRAFARLFRPPRGDARRDARRRTHRASGEAATFDRRFMAWDRPMSAAAARGEVAAEQEAEAEEAEEASLTQGHALVAAERAGAPGGEANGDELDVGVRCGGRTGDDSSDSEASSGGWACPGDPGDPEEDGQALPGVDVVDDEEYGPLDGDVAVTARSQRRAFWE